MLLHGSLDDLDCAVHLMEEVTESCARNPELGECYIGPGLQQPYKMHLLQWKGEIQKKIAKHVAEAAIFNMATANGKGVMAAK